ncbi:L-methionine/branched-chain amino acid transporter [Shewanella intestini]|uniref:L-methionine/branched-chain amino acid transporter n=1 Tax=Shewanella intestini TaxID=2017544 RepID=A0ABS5I4A0_9GAMM|nr:MULTISPECIES: L-methionine/branched-chain amino acid transporter [Shewanella]MBR9728736.1 L-methionine/branched-chain amino acid transporter [Shewanella intestini]MRG36812.1 L-methionine/branched-chain amino acid transporter [Shewanella sp. XMDDZSB0408]
MNQNSVGIGRWQGAGLMATTLLGTGVFILPQMTIAVAHDGALLAWGLLTLAIIPVALVFGLLAGRFPHAAGPAYFVEQAFGKTAGRTIGLLFLLAIPIGAPAAILMTFQFMTAMVPMQGMVQLIAQLIVIGLLLLLNLKGIQISAKLQFALTLSVVGVVSLLIGSSSSTLVETDYAAVASQWQYAPVMLAMGIGFWSFLGIEAMTHLAGDFREPRKDMLPAMLMGTVLVGVIYLLCTFLLLNTPQGSSDVAMISAFNYWLAATPIAGWGVQVIGILGVASGLATVNVYAASSARLLWSFSEQGILPRYFVVKNQHGVPIRALLAILISMAFVMVVTYFSGHELEHLIAWSNGVFVVIYLLAMLSAFKLLSARWRPLIAASCVFCIGLGVALGSNMLYVLILIAVIAPLMWLQKTHIHRRQKS